MSTFYDNKGLFMEPTTTQHGNHMVMTNVTMPTKIKYLDMDTRFRDEYDPSIIANYKLSLPERINNVKSMTATTFEIPMTFYNVSAYIGNNEFTMQILLVKTNIVIPDGQYDAVSLIVAVNSQISAAGSPFSSIVFTIVNNRGVFTNNTASECKISFDVSEGAMENDDYSSNLGWLMGYRLRTYIIPSSVSQSSETAVDVRGPRYLYLIVDEFKNGTPHSFVSLSRKSELSSQLILARITMDYETYPYGSTLIAENGYRAISDTRRYSNEVNLQRFNISLVNEYGRIMDMNGTDFSFCLKLEHL